MMNLERGWVASVLTTFTLVASAAAPVAVVEDVQGKVSGVEFMDYVSPGKVIELGPRDSIVLSYLKSCWRESITGATVTVGEEQSTVRSGRVERTRVACGNTRTQLSARETSQSAAAVFRGMREQTQSAPPGPQLLHGRAPLVEVNDLRGLLVITRDDVPVERFEFKVEGDALVRGRFFDIARTSILLTRGATYTATLGGLKVEFEVDADATPGAGPVAGRLLRFGFE